MADVDDNKPDNSGIPKDGEGHPEPETVAVDKAELARLQGQDRRMTKLDDIAEEVELDSAEDYLDTLETSLYQSNKENKPNPEPTPESKTPEATPAQPAATMDGEVRKQLEIAQQGNLKAILSSNYAEFALEQMNRKEEERTVHSKKDLTKAILGKSSALVADVARDFDGNLFKAADHILTIKAGGLAKARKEGADSQAAIEAAKASTDLGTGGGTPVPEKEPSQEEKYKELQDKMRQDIWPDDPEYKRVE